MVMTAGSIQLPPSAATKQRRYNEHDAPVPSEDDEIDFPPIRPLPFLDPPDDPFPDGSDATDMSDPVQILAFADASFGDESTKRRSMQGVVVIGGGQVVHWSSKVQKLTAVMRCADVLSLNRELKTD